MYTIEIHTLKLRYPNTKLRMTLLALSVKEQGFLFFFFNARQLLRVQKKSDSFWTTSRETTAQTPGGSKGVFITI